MARCRMRRRSLQRLDFESTGFAEGVPSCEYRARRKGWDMQALFERMMSGAYDWIIFPAGLTMIALMIFFGVNNNAGVKEWLACERAANFSGSKERLVACRVKAIVPRPPAARLVAD
jgi:hypothetical protein